MRKSKVVIQNVTAEQADEAMRLYADANSRLKKIEADIELATQKIREKYTEDIDKQKELMKDSEEVLEVYALTNKDELFSKKKSFDMVHGIIGFRIGTPKLKLLNKTFKWDMIPSLLNKFLPNYVRKVEEVNKELIIADRENPVVKNKLEKCGLAIDQDERFFIEVKEEELVS